MPTSRILTIPDDTTKDWIVSQKGEMVGDLLLTKNIDLESNKGKVRLAERVFVFYDNTSTSNNFSTGQFPRMFLRSNADGTDRFWAGVRDTTNGASAMLFTDTATPLGTWATDLLLGSPLQALDSMELFLRDSTGFDRLVVPVGASNPVPGNLAMLNKANAVVVNIQASSSPGLIQITTSTPHGLFTGNDVTIANHLVNTDANGNWTITKVDATNFTLNGSAGATPAGGATGTVTSAKWLRAWWTGNLGQTALDYTNPIVVKKFSTNKLLLVGNGNFVHTIDGNLNVVYKRLTFPDQYVVNCIACTPDFAWIFLKNIIGGEAIVARWDGGEDTYETPINLYDQLVHAACIKDGIPYCVNGKGQILRHNGQAFEQIAVFPVYYAKARWTDNTSDFTLAKVMNRNGMVVIDGNIHMLVKGTCGSTTDRRLLEYMPAGIWVLTSNNGLYCKYSLGNYKPGFSTPVTTDYGCRTLAGVGAIFETSIDKGRFLVGAETYTDLFSSKNQAIYASKTDPQDSGNQRGHFITRQFHSSALSTLYVHQLIRRIFWEYMTISFEEFLDSSKSIIIKMRTERNRTRSWQPRVTGSSEIGTASIDITWVDGTSFTCSSGSGILNAAVGDEIEFIVGVGAGATAHIVSISTSGGTRTVVIDETMPVINGGETGSIMTNNFIKIANITSLNFQDFLARIARNTSWIQFKVELRGSPISPEIKDLNLSYKGLTI